eukprot:TRINITY_DN20847_c0_g1_i1.p1 TRINITY_DN20847_c0_g1~~TRINITY_DN20847_c0_g1_i1.p1  ORF type:complete len:211 (+),score=43.18 TRINITY_DN20847_c0_g1_i1:576-1208(+)
MMAARAGARDVTAVEATGLLAKMATRVVARNGWSHAITVVNKWSVDMDPAELRGGKADVLVSEVVNTGLIGESMLTTFNDAHSRLLQPGAIVIPRAAGVEAFLIESPDVDSQVRVGDEVDGFDLSDLNAFSPADYMQYELSRTSYRPLTNKFVPLVLDLRNQTRSIKSRSRVRASRSGVAVAVAWWFVLELDEQTPVSYTHLTLPTKRIV